MNEYTWLSISVCIDVEVVTSTDNMLRPCPMLENPEKLQEMVRETGAKSTDLQSPESAEHLCGKCEPYAAEWKEHADKIWAEHPFVKKGYKNYKSEIEGTDAK